MRYISGLMIATILTGCAGSGPRTQDILTNDRAVVAEQEQVSQFAVVPVSTRSAKTATEWLEKSQVC